MAERRMLGLLGAVGCVVAPIAALWMGAAGAINWWGVVVALAVMMFGSLFSASVSSGNRLTMTAGVAAALPFVFAMGDTFQSSAVVATYLLAFSGLAVTGPLRGVPFDRSVGYAARQLIGYTSYAGVFVFVRRLVGDSLGTSSGWEILIPFAVAGLAWFAVEIGLWAIFASEYRQVSARYLALAGLKDANVFVSLVATGALFGLMFEALGWWALPVALLPYSFAHAAFRRFQATRSTYKQTIRALARIPEAAGLNLNGHADRTSSLSLAMAKDLGLTPEEVEDVEFAALMHDIGRITLNEPTVVDQGWTNDDLARWGSEIIAGAPSLDRVAGYVRRQYEPFRKPGEDSDPDISTVARIVKVASAYDAAVAGEGLSSLEAVELLHQGAAYEYDPEVVASLRRVIELPSDGRRRRRVSA